MKRINKIKAAFRELNFIARGLLSTRHPILAHIIPMRRCNLSCAYCNEYDKTSEPVPTQEMIRRVDKLASFKTSIITISGGEPLLHPELEKIIARIRHHGMIAGLISNGYLMTRERIRSLNEAGLEYLQISIDNVMPDHVSMKSLKVLDKKLKDLSELAEFKVNINSVIGSAIRNPEDALVIAQRAVELGFSSSLGIIHDRAGRLKPLSETQMIVFKKMKKIGKFSYARLNKFQDNLAFGKPNDWRCRAGGRYLYICENGLVHYCSQQRGCPAIPLEEYTWEDIKREYNSKKACAPYCTVACVHQISLLDNWRSPQQIQGTRQKNTGDEAVGFIQAD